MLRGAFEGWHIIILLVLIVVLFGFRRLPDAARSLGRSMRIFKAEVSEMKNDTPSAASSDTVKGETVADQDKDPGGTQPQSQPQPHQEPGARGSGSSGAA